MSKIDAFALVVFVAAIAAMVWSVRSPAAEPPHAAMQSKAARGISLDTARREIPRPSASG